MCERHNLMTAWGHATVRLSSANTYSYGTKDVTLKHYIDTMVKPQDTRTPANGEICICSKKNAGFMQKWTSIT